MAMQQPVDIGSKGAAGARLRTPRAAAVAGILFSLLLIVSLYLLWRSIPIGPQDPGKWVEENAETVALALNLVPFAGVAFLWFVGVLRDRLGGKEDRFFATVFLGSGLLFLGMLFVAAAAIGALVLVQSRQPDLASATAFAFGRAFAFNIMHVYAFRMAAVFMISTSTLAIYTRIAARWIAFLGYAAALFLLLGSGFFTWTLFVFPSWVLLISTYILIDNFRARADAGT